MGGAVSVEELKVLQQQLGDAGINKTLGESISPAYGNLLTKYVIVRLIILVVSCDSHNILLLHKTKSYLLSEII